MVDVGAIAQGTVTVLSPFLPFLVPLGKSVQKKLEEVIAEQGGTVVWDMAQKLWSKITGRLKHDPVVTAQATIVADAPQDAGRRQLLAQVLAERLQADPELAQELLADLGGPEGVNRVIGGTRAQISDVDQQHAGVGLNEVQAGDEGVIRGIRQVQGFGTPVTQPASTARPDER